MEIGTTKRGKPWDALLDRLSTTRVCVFSSSDVALRKTGPANLGTLDPKNSFREKFRNLRGDRRLLSRAVSGLQAPLRLSAPSDLQTASFIP